MQQNIRQNRKSRIDSKLCTRNYFDYMLYKGDTTHQTESSLYGMAIADFSSLMILSGVLYSDTVWTGATNGGVEMEDIGFTGMDNGLIRFRKDRITNEQFLKLWTDSTYSIESGDTRLFLTPVTGNTQMYRYPMFFVSGETESYIAFMGGFYQGFFKLEGFDYQVLPQYINDEWLLHFEIRPRTDYTVEDDTINHTHSDNEGIFFYMGTRAENKFWPFYKVDSAFTEDFKIKNAQTEGYFDGCGEASGDTYNIYENPVIFYENEWLLDNPPEEKPEGYFAVGDEYFAGYSGAPEKDPFRPQSSSTIIVRGRFPSADEALNVYDYAPDAGCGCPSQDAPTDNPNPSPCNGNCNQCTEYFADDYYDNKCPEEGNNKMVVDEYIGSGIVHSMTEYEDSDGHAMTVNDYYEITTDNKFLLFDHTPSGFTVDNWKEGTKVMFRSRKPLSDANYFLLFNHTDTGYTVDTIAQYNAEHENKYDLMKDIRGNAFALRIRPDGAIGYRYGVLDCDAESKYHVEEEYSRPGIVKTDEWNSVNVKFSVLNPSSDKCDTSVKKMRILFYVNGFLVFISKELDTFSFKALDEVYQKQETVPYNISLGGGTLGLLETILPNYYAISDYILPLERDFCGSFIGDIKSFTMYEGLICYSSILNYLSMK